MSKSTEGEMLRPKRSAPTGPGSSYESLYDSAKGTILMMAITADDKATAEQLRHRAHDAVFDIFRTVCTELRKHPDLNLEQALFMFGERP